MTIAITVWLFACCAFNILGAGMNIGNDKIGLGLYQLCIAAINGGFAVALLMDA